MLEPQKKYNPYAKTAGFALAAIPAVGLSIALCPSTASADSITVSPSTVASTASVPSASPTQASEPNHDSVSELYASLGGESSELGKALGDETAVQDGSFQIFEHGRIYFTQGTGAHVVSGNVLESYLDNFGSAGKLGFPIEDAVETEGHATQQFEHGVIEWVESDEVQVTVKVAEPEVDEAGDDSADADETAAPAAESSASATTSASPSASADTSSSASATPTASTTSASTSAEPSTTATSSNAVQAADTTAASSAKASTTGASTTSAATPSVTASTAAAPVSTPAVAATPSGSSARTQSASALNLNQQLAQAINALYTQLGGASGLLGSPVGDLSTLAGGAYQQFEHGRIYSSTTGGTQLVFGAILNNYVSLGASQGSLGLPISGEIASGDGVYQQFQNGRIYWSDARGAQVVTGNIATEYANAGGSEGILGNAVGGTTDVSGGSYQQFDGGRIYSNGSSAYTVHGAISNVYLANGGQDGLLGLPTSDEIGTQSGVIQHFQHGVITWSEASGALIVWGGLGDVYIEAGAETSVLGLPTASGITVANGWYQEFQNGRIYWSNAGIGSRTIGAIHNTYVSQGGSSGYLGMPTGNETGTKDGVYQQFEHGRIYWSEALGTHTVIGAILNEYKTSGAAGGILGQPTSNEIPSGSGIYQEFQNGRIYWSESTDAVTVFGAILATYVERGGAASGFGLPTSNEIPSGSGVVQTFQNSNIYWSDSTGTQISSPGITNAYQQLGGTSGLYGEATSGLESDGSGAYQSFQGGRIYWSTATGGHGLHGAILNEFLTQGGAAGYLGMPLSDEMPVSGGVYQIFQGGQIYWGESTGAHAVHGAMLEEYMRAGGADGALMLPNGNETPTGSGVFQTFQNAIMYWQDGRFAYNVQGAILATYLDRGAMGGALGVPTSNETANGEGGVTQTFQNGSISWAEGRGTTVTVNSSTANRPAAGDEWGYISWVAGFAQEEDRRYGVPASVAIAQSIIESGWGQSSLTLVDNNYFGIKCPAYGSPYVSGCTDYSTTEYYDGQYVTIQAGFRRYNSPTDSFLDHGFFLSLGDPNNTANRYYPAFHTGSSQGFIRAVAAAGYATDPTYANKIISVMDRYNLYQYDV